MWVGPNETGSMLYDTWAVSGAIGSFRKGETNFTISPTSRNDAAPRLLGSGLKCIRFGPEAEQCGRDKRDATQKQNAGRKSKRCYKKNTKHTMGLPNLTRIISRFLSCSKKTFACISSIP